MEDDKFYERIKDDLRQIEEVRAKYPRIAEIVNFDLIVQQGKKAILFEEMGKIIFNNMILLDNRIIEEPDNELWVPEFNKVLEIADKIRELGNEH